jgi:toxin ParE1/3/4
LKWTVRVLGPAERDLFAIHDYVRRDAPKAADRLLDDLLSLIESLGQHPLRGAVPRDEVLRGRAFHYVAHREYLVFYKVSRRTVIVHRVIHGRRRYQDLL